MKLSSDPHERAMICTRVPSGLCRLKSRSLIQVCVPLRPSTLMSLMAPLPLTASTELTVGVPLAEIVLGTSLLVKVVQVVGGGVNVGVGVFVTVGVFVGVPVGVVVAVGVAVAVRVGVAVGVLVGVRVGVAVLVGVPVGSAVGGDPTDIVLI